MQDDLAYYSSLVCRIASWHLRCTYMTGLAVDGCVQSLQFICFLVPNQLSILRPAVRSCDGPNVP